MGWLATEFKGNKREIPGDLPVALWHEKVLEYEQRPGLSELPWYSSEMECLTPRELNRLRAKALVWRGETGQWPEEIAWWWEVRMARRRGDIPAMDEIVEARIDANGLLHCGKCDARWSANYDGTPHPDRCKLCDRLWVVVADERTVGC